jgi:O-succinylbenzoate synthase
VTIERYDIFRYNIPFVAPMRLTGQNLSIRSGYIIALHSRDGSTGYGEIAPLPGLHRETPQEAFLQAVSVLQALIGYTVSQEIASGHGALEKLLAPYALSPSVRTGIEMALLNLLAVHTNTTLPALLSPRYHETIPLNGLLSGSMESIENGARNLLDEGYRTFKVKVGRLPIEQEIAMVKHVRHIIGNAIALRLDANRSWTLETALRFGEAVAECGIEYIEEPLAKPEHLREFVRRTGISIALDESLADTLPLPEIDSSYIRAIVLKPAVIGGIERTMDYIRLARTYGVEAVLSSAFETGVALSVYACLAAVAHTRETACGLDTYKQLAEDIPKERFEAVHGRVDVIRNWQNSWNLRQEILDTIRTDNNRT